MLPIRRLAISLTATALIALLAAQSVFADQRDFTLVNQSTATLREIYVAPVGSGDWEENIISSDVLEPGTSLDVSFPDESLAQKQLLGVATNDGSAVDVGQQIGSSCLYNIKVVGVTGEVGFMYGLNLCGISSVTFSDLATNQ